MGEVIKTTLLDKILDLLFPEGYIDRGPNTYLGCVDMHFESAIMQVDVEVEDGSLVLDFMWANFFLEDLKELNEQVPFYLMGLFHSLCKSVCEVQDDYMKNSYKFYLTNN